MAYTYRPPKAGFLCRVCEKWVGKGHYSNKEIDKYAYKFSRGNRITPISARLRCRSCAGEPSLERECFGPCGEIKPLDQFSKSSRRAGGSGWCLICTLWKESAEPSVTVLAPPSSTSTVAKALMLSQSYNEDSSSSSSERDEDDDVEGEEDDDYDFDDDDDDDSEDGDSRLVGVFHNSAGSSIAHQSSVDMLSSYQDDLIDSFSASNGDENFGLNFNLSLEGNHKKSISKTSEHLLDDSLESSMSILNGTSSFSGVSINIPSLQPNTLNTWDPADQTKQKDIDDKISLTTKEPPAPGKKSRWAIPAGSRNANRMYPSDKFLK
ncbi:Bgt-2088 [Blumeria graminis f. sp. tritici]|uniref:Bgt-2088 n=2 Tax=Blumeria graminis f. sp. tritici TaxID=62690 RepID=A0A061HKQ2_BLUGR|nr:hypothetical protein BGT96224_2088 [Blumeria graminis f. sp. tritici 96224]VCU40832.1 Bgt-2088 [Blumeria graminis f. sp. tritici]